MNFKHSLILKNSKSIIELYILLQLTKRNQPSFQVLQNFSLGKILQILGDGQQVIKSKKLEQIFQLCSFAIKIQFPSGDCRLNEFVHGRLP